MPGLFFFYLPFSGHDVLCLVSFTCHTVFKMYSHCSICQVNCLVEIGGQSALLFLAASCDLGLGKVCLSSLIMKKPILWKFYRGILNLLPSVVMRSKGGYVGAPN
jgi:hypothetical protein